VKTLALVQGDLSLAPGGYLFYEGALRIHQDLSLALREAYGADFLHPRWGSILQDIVGSPITAGTKNQILSEINRVISNYITVQNSIIQRDSQSGSISNLSTDDVVNSVTSINVQQIYDSIVVSVVLQTISRQSVTINQIVS
jgi:phage baseplate assembly protein W